MRIDPITIEEPEVKLHGYEVGHPKSHGGNLGSGFLKLFRLTFDLPHDRIFFERLAR